MKTTDNWFSKTFAAFAFALCFGFAVQAESLVSGNGNRLIAEKVPEILICKTSERTDNGNGTYTYTDSQSVVQTFQAWAPTLAEAVTLADGTACSF